MQRNEFAQIYNLMVLTWPKEPQTKERMEIYFELLKDNPVEIVKAAVLAHAADPEKGMWFPAIADIRRHILAAAEAANRVPTGYEAWEEVIQAIRWYGRSRKPEKFSHPLITKCVDVMGWAEMCMSEQPEWTRYHFLKCYDQLVARARTETRMIPQMRALVDKLRSPAIESGRGKVGELPASGEATDIGEIIDSFKREAFK
jgi:ABC-type molybdate transport system substrate-binding protein